MPTVLGIFVLAVAGTGTVALDTPASAGSYSAASLTGTDAVGFSGTSSQSSSGASEQSSREMALSRDSERQAMADAADAELQQATEKQAAERSARQVRHSLGEVPVDVTIEFEPVRLSPARIAELAPGDVITLNHRVMTPLTVRCGDFAFTRAIPGREGNRLAGLVVDKKLGS